MIRADLMEARRTADAHRGQCVLDEAGAAVHLAVFASQRTCSGGCCCVDVGYYITEHFGRWWMPCHGGFWARVGALLAMFAVGV